MDRVRVRGSNERKLFPLPNEIIPYRRRGNNEKQFSPQVRNSYGGSILEFRFNTSSALYVQMNSVASKKSSRDTLSDRDLLYSRTLIFISIIIPL